MPTISGPGVSFHDAFRFYLQIDGITNAKFKTCSGLTGTFDVVEHREGGTLIANKSAGLLNFGDVTLEQGVQTGVNDLYTWWLQGGDASVSAPQGPGIGTGVGAPGNQYKRNVEIVQMDRDGTELLRWRLVNAWINEFTPGEWDNEASEKVNVTVVLSYDYFTLV